MLQDGVSLLQAARLLSHSTIAVTEIYAHLVGFAGTGHCEERS